MPVKKISATQREGSLVDFLRSFTSRLCPPLEITNWSRVRESNRQSQCGRVYQVGTMRNVFCLLDIFRSFRIRQHLKQGSVAAFRKQKAIAHILGTLDDKIDLNRQMNATLEGMAQALFKSWFVDSDLVIDHALAAGNPISDELATRAEVRKKVLGERSSSCVSSSKGRAGALPLPDLRFPAALQFTEELRWVPEGWEVKPLSEAIQINPSVKLNKGTVAQFADMKALPTSGYAIDGVIEKEYLGGAKFHNDNVLFARITPCLENGKTGIADFLSTPEDIRFGSTEFIVLRGKGDLTLPYGACLARDETFRLHCKQSMVGSSGRQRVQNACFDSFHVATPIEPCILESFDNVTTPMFRKSSEHGKACAALTRLRDTLLPKLISGELRIGEAEQLTKEVLA